MNRNSTAKIKKNDKVVLLVFYPEFENKGDGDEYRPSFLNNIKYCISALIAKLKLFHGENSIIYIITNGGKDIQEAQVNSTIFSNTSSENVIENIKNACDDNTFSNNCHYKNYNSEIKTVNDQLKNADKIFIVGDNIEDDTFEKLINNIKKSKPSTKKKKDKSIYIIKNMSINYSTPSFFTKTIYFSVKNINDINSIEFEK